MLLCALGSVAAAVLVGCLAAQVAAGLARTLRGRVFDKTISFSMEEIDRFSTASLINRSTNDITQIQNLVAMGLQAIIKAPIMACLLYTSGHARPGHSRLKFFAEAFFQKGWRTIRRPADGCG